MTEADKEALIRAGIKFMDITDYPSTPVNSFASWVPCKHLIVFVFVFCLITKHETLRYSYQSRI